MALSADDSARHLEELSAWILDEQKAVTYKWLAHTLSIDVASAKLLLQTFCERQGDAVKAVHVICGRRKSTGDTVIRLVQRSALQDEKSAFSSITSEHVFSVHPQPVVDAAALHAADLELNIDLYKKRQPLTTSAESKLSAVRPVDLSAAAHTLRPLEAAKPAATRKLEAPAPAGPTKKPDTASVQSKAEATSGVRKLVGSSTASKKMEPAKVDSMKASKSNPFARAAAPAAIVQEAPKPVLQADLASTTMTEVEEDDSAGQVEKRSLKRLKKRRIVDDDADEDEGPENNVPAAVPVEMEDLKPKREEAADVVMEQAEARSPPAEIVDESINMPAQQKTIVKEVPKLQKEGKYLVMRPVVVEEKVAVAAPTKPQPASAKPVADAKSSKSKNSKESSEPKKQQSIHSFFTKK